WRLAQVPRVAGALVSLDPDDGAIRSLVGGFDYYQSKFNRARQARRQPGSNFKPFIYSAALENGFTTASIINDAPVVFEDEELEATWRPENYSGRFYGPTRLRQALIHSRNLVSIRILRQMGIRPAIEHIRKFGFAPEHLPRNLSLALGSANITPLELVRGYAVLANGGYRVNPYLMAYVENADGEVVRRFDALRVCREECRQAEEETAAAEEDTGEETGPAGGETAPAEPAAAAETEGPDETPAAEDDGETATGEPDPPIGAYGPPAPVPAAPRFREAERTVDARNVYLVSSMMRDVIKHGTGRGALKLGRSDLAGKTGTTNEQRDAWFSGFNREVVTTAWVGFDDNQPLGRRETGARAALPMWVDYMRAALKGVPEQPLEQPAGLVTARIDPETGEFVGADAPGAIFEVFREENVPEIGSQPQSAVAEAPGEDGAEGDQSLPQQLF
ncbi:MAG TPA: penicillin-binding transpeptidase domain-containing protein, partial [Gammaproteobacteria bacterium]|nr:penicillin-binding transpeptidase domain-containing protein [Gammaproteobacteria bacterium]